MAELRHVLSEVGFENVSTYIQSGNVIFDCSESITAEIEQRIKTAILNQFGFEVLVLVKTHLELQQIIEACPFSETEMKTAYFVMLHDTPALNLVAEASEKTYEEETYHIINNCIYFYAEKGFGRVKFNVKFFEGKLKTFATARNYNTMLKLLSLSL
ncbi:DUF1697 domain-containing protein [Bizionia sp. KMM 8389]